jgi:chromosome segregation ATPase
MHREARKKPRKTALLRLETRQLSEARLIRAKMRGLKRTQQMLNELESLSENIGRLIKISERHSQARQALEVQLDELRSDYASAQEQLAQAREERDALQAERDSLSAKIDDAQVRLNAILEKLPRAKAAVEPDNQLDLLPPDMDAHSHAEELAHGAMHEESQSHGEKA